MATLQEILDNMSPETRAHVERLGKGAVVYPIDFAREHKTYCHTRHTKAKRRQKCGISQFHNLVRHGYFIDARTPEEKEADRLLSLPKADTKQTA